MTQANRKSCTGKVVPEMKDDINNLNASYHRQCQHLPDILPAALEISSIKDILQQKVIKNILRVESKLTSLDIEIYKSRLNKIWEHNHTSTAKGLVASLITDIATISVTLDQISGEDERTARDILCRYLQTYGHIMRDQQQYTEAIIALEEAVKIAECVNNHQLLAVALLRLANIYYNRGDIALAQSKIDTASGDNTSANAKRASADADFQVAAEQFARVHSMNNLAPEIHIALLMGEGNVQACLAHGQNDATLESLALQRQAENMIANNYLSDSEGDEYSLFAGSIDIAKRRLQISKASALLAANRPHDALQELTDMLDLPPQGNMIRMNAYTNLLWAQAYADTGKLDGAALLAQDALTVMKRIKSEVNVARIRGLYRQLVSMDSSQIEVIRLGVMLV
jgi:tetratricopeptide (TPR) repeat protein